MRVQRRWRWFGGAAALTLALGGVPSASALTLQQLVDGASFDSLDGRFSFSDFAVGGGKAKGKGKKAGKAAGSTLADFAVIVTDDGFVLDLPDGTRGSLGLTYSVSSSYGLDGADLEVQGTSAPANPSARGKKKGKGKAGPGVLEEVLDGRSKIAKLHAHASGGPSAAAFEERLVVGVREQIPLGGGRKGPALDAVVHGFDTVRPAPPAVPAPGAAVLLGSAAAALLARRARREAR